MAWQKCPICDGNGSVPIGKVSTEVFPKCPLCLGARIIHEVTGKPPQELEPPKSDRGIPPELDVF